MTYKDERIAPSYITQYFEEINGLQAKSSRLTADPRDFETLLNMQFTRGFSVEGRKGCQLVGQPGLPSHIHTYSYLDIQTGRTESQLLGVNRSLWRLVQKSASISYAAGPSFTFSELYSRYNALVNGYTITLEQGGTPYFTQNVGEGFLDGYVTIAEVLENLNATANFNVVIPGSRATINGNQTAASVANQVTIAVTANSINVGDRVTIFNYFNNEWIAPLCVGSGANIILRYHTTIQVKNGQRVGVGCSPAASIAVAPYVSNTTTPKTFNWYEWEIIPSSLDNQWTYTATQSDWSPFTSWIEQTKIEPVNFFPASSINLSQNAYVLAPATLAGTTGYGQGYEGVPYRYDGRFVVRTGLPKLTVNSVTESMIGAATGTVAFMVVPRFRDYRGVIVEGPASDPVFITRLTTFASTYSDLVCSAIQHNTGFYTCGGRVLNSGAPQLLTSPSSTVNVETGHQFRVGDTIYFRTSTLSGGTLEFTNTAVITATTATTISFNYTLGAGDYLGVGDWISTALYIDIYRTKLNGSVFYYDKSYPNNPLASTQTIHPRSMSSDSYLTTPYNEPVDTYEPFPPPQARCMSVHDGAMVLAGGHKTPNSIFWSRPGADPNSNVESFPPLNTAVIPSAAVGEIVALKSITDERLIVGKDSGVYNLNGSIHNRNVGVDILNEDDWGMTSQAATARANDVVFSLSQSGFGVIVDGKPNPKIFEHLTPIIKNRQDLQFSMARSIVDSTTNTVHVFIPALRNAGTGGVYLVFDIQNNFVCFDRNYSAGMQPTAGMAVWNGVFYHASSDVYSVAPPNTSFYKGGLFRTLNIPAGATYAENFVDHTKNPVYQIGTNFLHDDSPSFDKMFLELKLWNLLLPSEVGSGIAANYRIDFYRDFNPSTIYATVNETVWNPETEFERIIKLFQECNARSMKFVITTALAKTTLRLTGFELVTQATQVYRSFRK